jgi:hypothetical protein
MNQYRCETCKHYHDETEDQYGMCYAESAHREAMYNDTYDHVVKYGCASHSDFQNQRENIVLFLEKKLKQMRNLDYTDMYPVNECLIRWIKELRGER